MIANEWAGRVLRLCFVLVCAVGASLGFAAGPHATSHAIVNAAPHGHHDAGGGDTSHALDEKAPVARRRRLVSGVVRRLPAGTVDGWVALVERARRFRQRARVLDLWPDRLAACTALPRLCIQRT